MGNDLLTGLVDDGRSITDPIKRAKHFTELIDDLSSATSAASQARHDALAEARTVKGMSQVEIADALGLTRARVNQMLKARSTSPTERALLAPDAGQPITIAVVEKRDTDTGQPVIALTTRTAVTKLQELAADLDVETQLEPIPPPGHVDLNRSNLVVLIGPRISSLIAQVVASDPVIQWRRGKRGRWYLVDTTTGVEYHSDFDEGWLPSHEGERGCIAHIGRIRRPDGQGSFLYLGGAHAPGTAGAVEVFVEQLGHLWAQARRSLWSAVVSTKMSEDGEIISAELATPVYTHGKR